MRVRLLVLTFLSGLVTACAGSFLAAAIIAIQIAGPLALPTSLLLGLLGLGYALPLAAPSAMLLGGLLWACGVQAKVAWAGTGALAGMGCYALAWAIPGAIGETAADLFGPTPMQFAPAFAIAGALAALLFRTLMRMFTGYAEALDAD